MLNYPDQPNVGSPYVLLTTLEKVMETGSTNPLDWENPNEVILTLQEGNLISFSEKKGSEHDSANPTVLIKFLDPEMIFLPRFFDQSIIRLYRSYFNQLNIRSSMPYKTKERGIVEANARAKTHYEATQIVAKEEGREQEADFEPLVVSSTFGENLIQKFTDKDPALFLKFGNGVGVESIWRRFLLTAFFISQDSANNMEITIQLSEAPLDAAEYRLAMSAKAAGVLLPGNYENLWGKIKDDDFKGATGVPILKLGHIPKTQSGKYIIDVIFYAEDLLISLLESLYQKFLLYHNPTVLPFVFLSPKIPNLIKTRINAEVERQIKPALATGTVQEGEVPYRTDERMARAELDSKTVTGPTLTRYEVLQAILKRCNIDIVKDIDLAGPNPDETTVWKKEDKDELFPTTTYYLKLPFPTSYVGSAEAYVQESIRNLYTILNLEEGGYPLDLWPGLPMNITSTQHKRLFLDQFCEKGGYSDVTEISPIFGKEIIVGETFNYLNEYAIPRLISEGRERSYKRKYDRANLPEPRGPIVKTSNNLKGRHVVPAESLSGLAIKVYTDNVIGNGLIAPMTVGVSENIIDAYVNELRGPFATSPEAIRYSNAYKFLFGSEGPQGNKLTHIKDYLKAYNSLFGGSKKDDFDYKDLGGTHAWMGRDINIPIFISNKNFSYLSESVKPSNVLEIISSERNISFQKLLDSFNIVKTSAIGKFGYILRQKKADWPEFDEKEFDRSIESMYRKAYKNNASTHTLLLALAGLPDKIDKTKVDDVVKGFFQELKIETKSSVEKSQHLKGKRISYAGLTAHLNYIQSLSNNVATVAVKTLPFFNLVDPFVLGKPCLFLNNTSFHALTRGIPPKGFLSGIYLISNYEHNISNGECFSKFDIVRQALPTIIMQRLKGSGDPTQLPIIPSRHTSYPK